MCVISYVPLSKEGDFMIIHNRDEAIGRRSELPLFHTEMNSKLFYPKDIFAGGTWIGLSGKNRFISLANGAFKKHVRTGDYRKSRGVVLKEILASEQVIPFVKSYDFQGIEPFFSFVFLWEDGLEILEVVWDGEKIHIHNKDVTKPHIWFSAMIYSVEEGARKRSEFERITASFEGFKELPSLLWKFHHSRKDKVGAEGLVIDRGILKTTSISQFIHRVGQKDSFRFKDLISGEETVTEISWE